MTRIYRDIPCSTMGEFLAKQQDGLMYQTTGVEVYQAIMLNQFQTFNLDPIDLDKEYLLTYHMIDFGHEIKQPIIEIQELKV